MKLIVLWPDEVVSGERFVVFLVQVLVRMRKFSLTRPCLAYQIVRFD